MAYIGSPAAPKIATVSDDTITTAKIVDDAVTAAKISNTEDIVVNGLTVGKGAGDVTTNTAVGASALASNTTAAYNTSVGYQSLYSNTAGYNTAVGHQSLQDNTTGTPNTAVGAFALGNNTTAANNTAVGYAALFDNTTGASNTAIGTSALENNTTATNNTAVGYQAAWVVTTGSDNTIIGRRAAHQLTTGTLNAFLGLNSGNAITTGSKNTILGSYTGNQGGLDIRTANNQIVISDGDGNWRARWTDVGHMLVGGAGGQINNYLAVDHATGSSNGSSFYACYYNGTQIGHISQSSTSSVAYNTTSDYRLKTDVQSLTGATDRLKQLNPVNFEWISDGTRSDGFIAHEVQTVVPEAISGEKDAIDENGNPVYQGIDQSKLIPLLVATIQELEARIAALETN